MISAGERLVLPLIVTNPGPATTVTVRSILPDGWRELSGSALYPVEAHGSYTIQTVVQAPQDAKPGWVAKDVVWVAEAGGKEIGSAHMRIQIGSGGLPQ